MTLENSQHIFSLTPYRLSNFITFICNDLLFLSFSPFGFPCGFPCSSLGKESTCSAGDLCSIPGLGRSPGEGNGNSLQYHCLENLMDRGAWWAATHGGPRVRHNLATEQQRWEGGVGLVNSAADLCFLMG